MEDLKVLQEALSSFAGKGVTPLKLDHRTRLKKTSGWKEIGKTESGKKVFVHNLDNLVAVEADYDWLAILE